MQTITSFHTDSDLYPPTLRRVYFTNDTCPLGMVVLPEHRETGTGGKTPCPECEEAVPSKPAQAALERAVEARFDSQFLEDPATDARPWWRVGGVQLTATQVRVLKSDVVTEAFALCMELDAYEAGEGQAGLITAALGNAWNRSVRRRELALPPWPWR